MEDKEIVRLFERRDERAVSETAEKYSLYCRRIGMNILQSPEDCDECFDDTLMKLWENIPPEKPQDLGAYLAVAMRSSALSRYRKQNAKKRTADSLALAESELTEILPDSTDIQSELEAKELLKAVNSFLRSLPKNKRLLFVRRYFYLDSLSDAAEYCGMNPNKAGVTLLRIRKKLRAYLEKEGLTDSSGKGEKNDGK